MSSLNHSILVAQNPIQYLSFNLKACLVLIYSQQKSLALKFCETNHFNFAAIKQHPSRHNRTKSIAENPDETVRDVNEQPLTNRGGPDRRSYQKQDSE